jgi:hypothetical protein
MDGSKHGAGCRVAAGEDVREGAVESSLHRQLKARYAQDDAQQEVPVHGYRIDVVADGTLIEIQHGAIVAIRDKIAELVQQHIVLLVKPIVARKKIVRLDRPGGEVVSARWSPKRGTPLDLFGELVHFTRVFPHPHLTLEVPLVEIEERRYPGHGRRRWRRDSDHQVEDQRLIGVGDVWRFRRAEDLWQLLPKRLPRPFHTGQLAQRLGVDRSIAQRIAYCMYHMGATQRVGKRGNALLYQTAPRRSA